MITIIDCPHCRTTSHLKVDRVAGMGEGATCYVHCMKCGIASEWCSDTDAAIMAWNILAGALAQHIASQRLLFTPGSGYSGMINFTVRCDQCGGWVSKDRVNTMNTGQHICDNCIREMNTVVHTAGSSSKEQVVCSLCDKPLQDTQHIWKSNDVCVCANCGSFCAAEAADRGMSTTDIVYEKIKKKQQQS